MGIDEDEEVCDGLRERERVLEGSPGVGICVKDDCEEGGGKV